MGSLTEKEQKETTLLKLDELHTIKLIEHTKEVEVPVFKEVEILKPVLKDVVLLKPVLQERIVEVDKVSFVPKEITKDITDAMRTEIATAIQDILKKVTIEIKLNLGDVIQVKWK